MILYALFVNPFPSEYMDRVNQRSERDRDKKLVVSEPKKFVELADRSINGSRDNCILSEFMQMRDAKFSKVTNDNDVINDKAAKAQHDDNSRWRDSTNRLSKSSSAYSVRSSNGYSGLFFIIISEMKMSILD